MGGNSLEPCFRRKCLQNMSAFACYINIIGLLPIKVKKKQKKIIYLQKFIINVQNNVLLGLSTFVAVV